MNLWSAMRRWVATFRGTSAVKNIENENNMLNESNESILNSGKPKTQLQADKEHFEDLKNSLKHPNWTEAMEEREKISKKYSREAFNKFIEFLGKRTCPDSRGETIEMINASLDSINEIYPVSWQFDMTVVSCAQSVCKYTMRQHYVLIDENGSFEIWTISPCEILFDSKVSMM